MFGSRSSATAARRRATAAKTPASSERTPSGPDAGSRWRRARSANVRSDGTPRRRRASASAWASKCGVSGECMGHLAWVTTPLGAAAAKRQEKASAWGRGHTDGLARDSTAGRVDSSGTGGDTYRRQKATRLRLDATIDHALATSLSLLAASCAAAALRARSGVYQKDAVYASGYPQLRRRERAPTVDRRQSLSPAHHHRAGWRGARPRSCDAHASGASTRTPPRRPRASRRCGPPRRRAPGHRTASP